MKFLVEINDPIVKRAAHIVETHYADPEFRKLLDGIRFNHTTFIGTQCFDIMGMNLKDAVVKILSYKTFNPWSNVIGYSIDDDIFVNTRKLHLPLQDRVENIWHELSHVAGFSHNGNRVTEYNLKTFPYLGSSIFVKYLKSIGVL
jgi:hypothetical protein